MKRNISIGCFIALCGCAELGETTDDEVTGESKSKIIAGSTPSASDNLAKTVVKYTTTAGRNCSGVLVSTSWVLTAAHCVSSKDWGFTVTNSSGSTAKASSVIRHSQAAPMGTSNLSGYVDVALINLISPLGTNSTGWSGSTVSVGQTLKCYGYGVVDVYNNGWGFLRTANLNVVDTNGLPATAGGSPYPNKYTIVQNSSWQREAVGDSGGPCFNASGVLTGIQSNIYTGAVYWYAEQTKMSYVSTWVRNTILGCVPGVSC